MYNTVYLKFPKRVRDLKNYHHAHIDQQRRSCEVMDVFINGSNPFTMYTYGKSHCTL